VEIQVHVPVNEVYIIKRKRDGTEKRHNGSITLREGTDTGVACMAVVNGSTTPPTVRAFIGDEDETAFFETHPRSHIINPGDGLGVYSAETKVAYYTSSPNPEYNGLVLRCEGRVQSSETKEASVNINVEYKPRITCRKYQHYGSSGGTIDMECDVRSNPMANMSWAWSEVSLSSPGDDGHVSSKEVTLGPFDKRVTLRISHINDTEHFTDFTLTAVNPIGTHEVTIELHRSSGSNPNPKPNTDTVVGNENVAASCRLASVLLLCVTLPWLLLTRGV